MLAMYVFVEMAGVLYLGAIALHKLVDIDVMLSVVILATATGLYTILGGLRAVVWTERPLLPPMWSRSMSPCIPRRALPHMWCSTSKR